MSNEKNLPQPTVKFTELIDSETEQISGGDKFVFNPYSFAAPYGFIGPGFGSGFGGVGGGQQQQQQQQGGGRGRGNRHGHYK